MAIAQLLWTLEQVVALILSAVIAVIIVVSLIQLNLSYSPRRVRGLAGVA
jgi:hypothetical protein